VEQLKAKDVAEWFIAKAAESGDQITHLKLQKLLYYAEAWSQTLRDEELYKEEIQAWAHGPVVPEVFHEFKQYGWNPLPVPSEQKIPEIDNDVKDVLEQVFDVYADLPAKTLEDMTHQDDPWIKARGGISPEERCDTVMPKEALKKFFKEKYINNGDE
jgi:uncharacterized phage-associated protein